MEEWYLLSEPQLSEWMDIFDFVCQRVRVGESDGIEFIIHTKENGHNKPHLHARYQAKEVVLEIPTGVVLRGNLSSKKQKRASQWVIEHDAFLKEKWDELVDGVVCFG